MKSTLIVGSLIAVICTMAICVTIKSTPPPSTLPVWEYTVATGSLGDGEWIKAFGEKRWELVAAIGDGPTQEGRAFIFKRQKPGAGDGAKY